MQKKSEKSLEPFLRKLLPTNQLPTTPISYNLADAGPKIFHFFRKKHDIRKAFFLFVNIR